MVGSCFLFLFIDPYVIEILKPSRVAWQEDPRFEDSSSEDEELEAAEVQDVKER